MLRQYSFLPERLRCRRIILILAGAPALRLKHIDDVLPTHEVDEAAVERGAEFSLLVLNIKGDNIFPRLAAVDHEELHKVRLALTRVAEDEDIRRGLILIALVKVREDVAAVSVLADVEAVGIRLTGIIVYV